ncbi:MAG: dTMP kinase [Henriciella sp.]|nr:dTMP kinase [Henriciella sp.]
MRPGKFITLEGGEGTGKTTLITGLSIALGKRGIECIQTREPGGTPLAEAVRSLALHPPGDEEWSPLAHALLMNAARQDHLEHQIRPTLDRGVWVLCDRFADSTRAYQSIDGVSQIVLKSLEKAVVGETVPDLTLVLDADPDDLVHRRNSRGTVDAFEAKGAAFHEKVRQAFLDIAAGEPERCVVLSALQEPADILAQALEAFDNRLLSE